MARGWRELHGRGEAEGFRPGVLMMQVGTMALGAFVVGLLAEVMGPQVGLGSFALLLVVLALAAHVFAPKLRDLQ